MNSLPLSESMPQCERQSLLNFSKRRHNSELAFAHDRLSFHPAGGDIDTVQSVDELPSCRGARMRDQVDFQIAGQSHLPMIGLDRNHVFEK